ncbi:cell cycle control protein 50A-like isoform X1 [Portunus trituberculatus]|uniref:cell cycle control protein 50A-like isoform X1 n=1 Tax=Portunus trituberculatus TaxID=210409 RepID=UPI001E1CF73B|nr:cell cycle control protein 50A-like isoform X1 [Portunus trituberculatus]
MSAQDLTNDQIKAKQSKFNQKFKQQRLPAWQPILTADTVLPAFFLIGLLFVPLGAALLFFSRSVQEMQLDYTDCKSVSHMEAGVSVPCSEVIRRSNFTLDCTCQVNFTITEPFVKTVYLYYGLDNFYQNHRRYVKSRDDNQLLGKEITSPSNDCNPFGMNDGKIYAPCGAIANSMFNDSLTLFDAGKDEKLKLIKTGIAWPSDRKIKFNNPPGKLNDTGAFKNTIKPPYWTKSVWQLSDNPDNNGYKNEDLIVWMRSAAFPTFRKLYGKIDHSMKGFKFSFPKGRYYLEVQYRYPVDSFGGRKRMILSTTSFLGGKNNFLGIAYITVGCICLLLGIIFLIIHIKFGRRAVDQLNINQNTPYSD